MSSCFVHYPSIYGFKASYKKRTRRAMSILQPIIFKYNILLLRWFDTEQLYFYFEFGSTVQLNKKRNKSTKNKCVILCSCGINQSCTQLVAAV